MSITLNEIVEEVRRWPPEQAAELVDRLVSTIHDDDTAVDAWTKETRRRIAEIETGATQGVPGDEVSARIRRIVGSR